MTGTEPRAELLPTEFVDFDGEHPQEGKAVTAVAELPTFRLVIDGVAADSASGRTYDSTDPFTGQSWARVPDGTAKDVDAAVAAARGAFAGAWSEFTATRRGSLLRKLGDLIARDAPRAGRARDPGQRQAAA